VAWIGFFALLMTHPQRHLRAFIDERRDVAVTEEKNVRGYVATGDASFLAGAPALEIPYFEGGRLRALLDAPEIRSVLPPALLPRDAPHPRVEALKRGFLRLSYVWLAAGALLLVAVGACAMFTAIFTGSKLAAVGAGPDVVS
jgi:hypothetical protein